MLHFNGGIDEAFPGADVRTMLAIALVVFSISLGFWTLPPKDDSVTFSCGGQRIGHPSAPFICQNSRFGLAALPNDAAHAPFVGDLLFFDYDHGNWRALDQIDTLDATISPDGSTVAGVDGNLVLYDFKMTSERSRLRDSNGWRPVRFSPDSSMLVATSSNRKSIAIWDYRADTIVFRRSLPEKLEGIGWSPDSNFIACNVGVSTIIYSLKDPSLERQIGKKGMLRIGHPVFAPSGKLLAVADLTSTIRIWNMEDFHLLYSLQHRVAGDVQLLFSPNEKIVAATEVLPGAEWVRLSLWDLEKEKRTQIKYGIRESAQFSNDGRGILLLSSEEPVKRVVPLPSDAQWWRDSR